MVKHLISLKSDPHAPDEFCQVELYHFFPDPPFSKFGTEGCPPSRNGVGADPADVYNMLTQEYYFWK